MNKKLVPLGLAVLTLGTALVGCGKKDKDANAEANANAKANNAATQTMEERNESKMANHVGDAPDTDDGSGKYPAEGDLSKDPSQAPAVEADSPEDFTGSGAGSEAREMEQGK